MSNEYKKDNNLEGNKFKNDFKVDNSKGNYKLYQLLILVFIVSCIPLVNIANKVIVGLILSLVIIYFNIKLLENSISKWKIFFYSFIAILVYYLTALFQTFLTYLFLIRKISETLSFNSVEGSFLLIDKKVLILWLPLSITSLLCFNKYNTNSKIFKLYIFINSVIFIFVTM